MTRLNNLLNLVILAFLVSLLTPLAHGVSYTVKTGDSLTKIVRDACKLTSKSDMLKLAKENGVLNKIANINLILPGQVFNITCQEKKVAKAFVVPVAAPTKVEMAPAILPEPPAIGNVSAGSDLVMYMANYKAAMIVDRYVRMLASEPRPEVVEVVAPPEVTEVTEEVAAVAPVEVKKEVKGKKRYEVTRHLPDRLAAELYPEFRDIDAVAYFPAVFARDHDNKINRWKHRENLTVVVARVVGGYDLRIQVKELPKPDAFFFIDFKDGKRFEDFGDLLSEAEEVWVERDYPQLPKKEYTRLHDAVPKRAGFLLRAKDFSLRNVLTYGPSAALAVFSFGTSAVIPIGVSAVTNQFVQKKQTNHQSSETEVLRQEMGVLYEELTLLQQTLNSLQPAPQAQQK